MRATSWVTRAGRGLADLVMPRLCAACGTAIGEDEGVLCADCAWGLEAAVGGPYCANCGDDRGAHMLIDGRCTACRVGRSGPRFDRFVRVGRYTGTLRTLVLRFKKAFVLDRLLGRLLADAVGGRFDPNMVDYWVPVPAHWRRRLSLGFQPTDLLARAAVRACGGRVEPALRMTRYVRPFHLSPGLSAAQRARAIRGAFRTARSEMVEGRTICVVDDVMTTGATMGEAKRALRSAGAVRVFAAVVAKVSSRPVDEPGA